MESKDNPTKIETTVHLPGFSGKTIISACARRNYAYVEIDGVTLPDNTDKVLDLTAKYFNNGILPVDLEDLFELGKKYCNVIEFEQSLPQECCPDRIVKIDNIQGNGWNLKEQQYREMWSNFSHRYVIEKYGWKSVPEPLFALFINTKGVIKIWIPNISIPATAGFDKIKFNYTLKEEINYQDKILKLEKEVSELKARLSKLENSPVERWSC